MNKCQACGSTALEYWKEYIFTNIHEWNNCLDCDHLWIKRLDNGDWIDSSSTTCAQHVYDESVKQNRKFRELAS